MRTLFAGLLLATFAGTALAQATPAGLWKTIDDETQKEKSFVRITEAGGVYTGKVERIVDPAKQEQTCTECSDERKGQKVLGMTIVRNVKAGDDGLYDGGDILDPNNGKVYKVRMKPVDGGRKLEVRGYVGAPLLGRTQTWLRVE